MQVVILAAGKGSRLHPITLDRSKAMLPILGKPMIGRVAEDIVNNGLTDFIIVTSPNDLFIKNFFQNEWDRDIRIQFVDQPKRLGMADALRYAAPYIREDFVLTACDNLISTQFIQLMLDKWREFTKINGLLTLMPVSREEISSVGIVEMEGEWVKRIVEKPSPETAPSNIASLPLYIFSIQILEYLKEVKLSSRGEYELQDAIQILIDKQGFVSGIQTTFRHTVTNAVDLLAINKHYLTHGNEKPQIMPQHVGPGTHLITPLHIEENVTIGHDCIIGPNVYIERNCQIGSYVKLENVVVLREVTIPDNVSIYNRVYA